MIISPLIIFFLHKIILIQCELINDPTLKPVQPFSACDDAEKIRKEITSFKIDRDKIANIYFHRTYDQRRQIEEYYNQKFCAKSDNKCPFHSALKDVSTFSLDALYNVSLTPPEGILAKIIYDSINGKCNDEGALEEAVCANDKGMKDLIDKYYKTNYQKTVEEHLATFKTDDKPYQDVMLKYCWKGLCQEKKLSPQDTGKESQTLRDLNHKNDKEGLKKKLTELFDTTCEPDLKEIFQKYRHDGKGIGKAVNKAFEVPREQRAYNTLVRYVENSCKFYAGQLNDALSGFYNMHATKINRIVLTRCERDLLCVLKEFKDSHHDKTFTNLLKVMK